MSDTSRKRSRKSKLVPRECSVDEDDLELQIPKSKVLKNTKRKPNKVKKPEPSASKPESTASKPEPSASKPESISSKPDPDASKPEEVYDTSVLKKINASARESDEAEETLPRKFEVNIEVESCDDQDYFGENRDQNSSTKRIVNSLLKKDANPTPIPLTLEFILEATDNLDSSTSIADRILNAYVRNSIGYEQRQKLVRSLLENQIQVTLDEWRTWQSRSFHREDPLFYKCYVCTRSYWYLSEFRNHLSECHSDDDLLTISLEKYEMHEANLIAYHQRLVVIKDIYTQGLCYRCGRDYSAHEISSRFQEKFYKQDGCSRHFTCCTGLRDHFPSCNICNVQGKPYQCNICKSRFDTHDELLGHLVLSHSVRSDVPIMSRYANCKVCLERYEWKYLHYCVDKVSGPNFECPHCLISFTNAMTLESHMKSAGTPYKCDICGDVMEFSCMKYDHMLLHTDNFMAVKKCMICDGLNVFVSDEDAKAHWTIKHKIMDLRRPIYFPKVFVPWSCIYHRLAEIELKEQESLLEAQESVSEVHEDKESGAEEQQSGAEEQQSGAEDQQSGAEDQRWETEEKVCKEEQESDIDEKESLLDIEEESLSASLQKKLDSAEREFAMGSVVIKEEPLEEVDLESPRLVIKEEPLEEVDNQMIEHENQAVTNENQPGDNFENQITVKQEVEEEEEELDEYEEDLIKLNFNIEDYMVKDETIDLDSKVTVGQDSDTEESLTKEFMLEPEIIITGEHRKTKKLYRCSTCGFQGKHREYRNHIEYDCTKNPKYKSYKCTKCDVEFGSMKKFLTHFDQHGYTPLSCPECLKQFKTFTYLGQHLQTHIKRNFVRVKLITYAGDETARGDFQCQKCSEKVHSTDFFQHWETHIKAKPCHPVKVISGPNPWAKQEMHGKLHETIIKECIAHLYIQPRECNHCHRMFQRTNECKRHIIEHLLIDAYNQKLIFKELRCQICGSGFPTSDKYKHHMRDHASLPVYKCELCDRTFSDSSNFTKHKKVHNLRVVVCDLCGKKFQSKLSLEKHIEQHQNSTPIVCKICKKIFYFETAYRRHFRSFHEKSTTLFRCVMCGERFDSLKGKWDHLWEVHKERKQKADCPICLQSFRKYSDVRAHAKRVHMTSISVLSVKRAKELTPNRHVSILNKCIRNTEARITFGRKAETLVVYDSD